MTVHLALCLFVCVCECIIFLTQRMEEEFVRWMDWYGKSYGEFEIMKGDFLDPEFNDIMQSAT